MDRGKELIRTDKVSSLMASALGNTGTHSVY